MSFKPLIIDVGMIKQLPSGQALDVGGWTLPTVGGTEDYVLTADASGNAVWAAGGGIPSPGADNMLYASTGVGTAAWTTTLDILKVDNITIDAATITSDTGGISFGDEDLVTTGDITGAEVWTNKLYSTGSVDPVSRLHRTGATVAGGQLGCTEFILQANTGVDMVDGFGPGFVFYIEDDGLAGTPNYISGIYSFRDGSDILGGIDFYTRNAGWSSKGRFRADGTLEVDGTVSAGSLSAGSLVVDNITIDGDTISSDNGSKTVNFTEHILVAGWVQSFNPTGGTALVGRDDDTLSDGDIVGQLVFWTNDQSGSGSPASIVYYCNGTWESNDRVGYISFKTQDRYAADISVIERMTIDNVGDVTIVSGGSLTVESGTVVGSNIPSPTVDDQVLISTASGVAGWSTAGADQYLAGDVDGEVAWADKVWTLALSANETIYVRTTGNDTTGDGSSGTPYLTVTKAIEVISRIYAGSYAITVDIGEGVFSEDTLYLTLPFGQQVTFHGVSEAITGQSLVSYGSDTSYGHNGLYYQDITIVLPVGKSVSVYDYIGIYAASGGVNPMGVVGLHEVVAWVGGTRTATFRRVYRTGSAAVSGAISVDIDLIKTVIAFSDSNGISVTGPYSGGTWQGLVIRGDYDANDAIFGVRASDGAVISLSRSSSSGDACGVHGFYSPITAVNNGSILADFGYVSTTSLHSCVAQVGGVLSLQSSKISAAAGSGIFASDGSTVGASSCVVVGTASNEVIAFQASYIDISDSFVGVSAATTSVMANRWSCVDGTGATVENAISPVTDGNNDGSYVIGL